LRGSRSAPSGRPGPPFQGDPDEWSRRLFLGFVRDGFPHHRHEPGRADGRCGPGRQCPLRPGESHGVVWQVEEYYPVDVLRKEGEWCFFRDFEDDKGWIHQSLLGDVPTVVTRRDKCNIRSGPGTRFDILFTVERGVPFKVVKTDGDWLNIAHSDGDQGWIHRTLVW